MRANKATEKLPIFYRFYIFTRRNESLAGSNPADASLNLCPGDGIGRHDGLKIRWLNKPWRFESALGHFDFDPK